MGSVGCACPWAEPHSRFTALFERLAIDWLRAASQRAVAEHLGLTWDEVHGIMERDERLKGTKYDWLKGRDKFDLVEWREFCRLRRSNLKTSRAWALKEQAMKLWDFTYPQAARNHFAWSYRWATHSRLPPMIEKAKADGDGRIDIEIPPTSPQAPHR